MALTLGAFYDDVRDTLARGSSLDARIPTWTRQAILLIERNHTFDYMKNFYFVVPEPDQWKFNLNFTSPDRRLKAPKALGILGASGQVAWLSKLASRSAGGQKRLGGWSHSNDVIYFSGQVAGSPGLILLASFFSELAVDEAETHPLLNTAEDLLKWQVMMLANAKDKAQVAIWQALRDEGLKTVQVWSDDFEHETDISMEYRGGSDGQLIEPASPAIEVHLFDVEGMTGVAGMHLIGGTT